ncbi:hypothetical protein G7046_g5208 [Stylonectria norvegica]|nr:hypothetical protein G7046_g5208 [Stylonectria norvegica]
MVHNHSPDAPSFATDTLPTATKADVESHFATHGTGEITEVKLMNGFGFIEYKDPLDARDVVPGKLQPLVPRDMLLLTGDGSDFMGERLTVQFARGSRHREGGFNGAGAAPHERAAPRPRRTPHRMQIAGLPNETSWQVCSSSPFLVAGLHGFFPVCALRGALVSVHDHPLLLAFLVLLAGSLLDGWHLDDLKDFARQSSLDVVYSETGRESNGRGFVEFETAADLRTAVEKLDGREFKGQRVTCTADTQPDMPQPPPGRGRSRSPSRRPYPAPAEDFDRRGAPPRGYSPRREGYAYRERSPRRDYYDDRAPRYRSPPRRPLEDYPPARGRYEEPYRRDYPPPPADPYANGRPPYDRPPRDFPPREPGYPREGGYPREYERGGRYW